MDWLKKNWFTLGMLGVLLIIALSLVSFRSNNLQDILGKEFPTSPLPPSKIPGLGRYSLDCQTTYFTTISTGGILLPAPFIKISEGHDKQVLYVEEKKAKFFGGEYDVVQDNTSFLVTVRFDQFSGITEVITLNKESGLGFDTKTLGRGITGGAISYTYTLYCTGI